jgi:adhesion G protein-coupled receptor L1
VFQVIAQTFFFKYIFEILFYLLAAHTSTTTHRPSPPWLITSQPSLWSTSTLRNPTTFRVSLDDSSAAVDGVEDKVYTSNIGRNNSVKTPEDFALHANEKSNATIGNTPNKRLNPILEGLFLNKILVIYYLFIQIFLVKPTQQTPLLSIDENNNVHNKLHPHVSTTLPSSVLNVKNNSRQFSNNQNTMNKNNYSPPGVNDQQQMFCGSTHARNLFWNITRVGEVNVQPCPGGATGIAKWRCIYVATNQQQKFDSSNNNYNNFSILNNNNGDIRNSLILNSDKNGLQTTMATTISNFDDIRIANNLEDTVSTNTINNRNSFNNYNSNGNSQAHWQPSSPDLSQCRSLWLNNLEVRVNQRDSSLISIATDLSQV